MLHLLMPTLLMICSIVEAMDISWQEIRTKLDQPLPEWMEKQIQEDLEPFYGAKITAEAIEATIRDVYAIPSGRQAGFVRFQIKDNRIFVTSPSENLSDSRISHIVQVLEEMAKHLQLPNMDFLASIWDSYDNPLYLEKTTCPVFTICKLKGNRRGVLFPEFRNFSYRQRLITDISWTSDRSTWEQKTMKAFWRGMTSGWNYTLYEWDLKPRSHLVFFSKDHPELVDAAFTSPYSLQEEVKKWMERYGLFQPWNYPVDFIQYKYLISIDGNTFASNFWWQLLSNCTVLKHESDFIEWFYKGVQPYIHYFPYQMDLSDLEETILWLQLHDDEARRIAEAGSAFAKEHLSNEGLIVYFYRLLLAYAALQK